MPKYSSQPQSLSTVEQAAAIRERQLAVKEGGAVAVIRPPQQLGLCLDVSGSMTPLVPAVVSGHNQLLAAFPECAVTRVHFGSTISIPVRQRPAGELLPMTEADYELQGQTALLDGFGDIIKEVGAVYDPPSKLNKPAVLIALLTDGFENASHRYRLDDVRLSVGYRRVTCNWQFIYLTAAGGTDYGLRLGIPHTHIASFRDPHSLELLLERLKKAIGAFYLGDRHFARFLLKEKN